MLVAIVRRRLVFETINSTNIAAVSNRFVIDAGWHHMAITADSARRVITFYLDGNQIVCPLLCTPNVPSCRADARASLPCGLAAPTG
jgi:hypothetical protein